MKDVQVKLDAAKKNLILYSVLVLVIFSFLLIIFINDRADNTRQQQSSYTITKWKDYQSRTSITKTVISGSIQTNDAVGNIFAFYSIHQKVDVYANKQLIYQYPITNNNPFAASPGYCWNFIELPSGTVNLEIIISSPYRSYLKSIPAFYVGNHFSLPAYIVSSNLMPFLICVIMFVMGLVFVAYHIVMSKNVTTQGKLLKLGIFSLFLSIWSINECSMTTLIMKNNIVTSYISFLSLMMLPFPFAIFVKTFYEDNSTIWDNFCYMDIIQVVVCFLLMATGICDLRESLWTTHVMMCILVFIILMQSVKMLKTDTHSHMVMVHLFCICICVLSLVLDIVSFYIGLPDGNTFGRLGFLSYIIIMGIASTLESASLIKKGQEASAYQKLAYTDQMTGLNNRTCFNIDFEIYSQNPTDIAIIDFDLNNLKRTNDTLGHSAGDRYIKNCANIIYEIFNGIGKCYRVGGDEFVTLVEHSSNIDMTQYLAMLESSVDASNRENKDLRMQIAYGCAVYSPNIDKNLEDTYNRADKIMYHDKKSKKEIGKNNAF